MASSIIGGLTQQYYHTVPDSLDLILTNPTKEAIFGFLSQIHYAKFPEFILDILVKIEGHAPVDITDGPGDQKQDILTINPQGERCLTQCKHTVKPNSNYSGDELDRLVAACLRKQCNAALFVTNGDLTPQAKTYITDKEYNRGTPTANGTPFDIDYWNDLKIWEKIKDNSDILNKWFSGMGQAGGLRSFQFDVTVQQLPYKGSRANTESYDDLIALLTDKGLLTAVEGTDDYSAQLPSGTVLTISRWFQFSGQLDIRYMLPDESLDFLEQPMYALRIKAQVPAQKYDPDVVRGEIVSYLFDGSLPQPAEEGMWWHLTTGKCVSFIYLYDIGNPREVTLASAKTFVKVGDYPLMAEVEYCTISAADFKPVKDENDEYTEMWEHNSGVTVFQMFDQKLDPAEIYHHQTVHLSSLAESKQYEWYAAERIQASLAMRVRRILPSQWIALTQEPGAVLYWIVTDETDKELVHQKLEKLGVKVLRVREEDLDAIISNISKDLPPVTVGTVTEMDKVSFPISLERRMIGCFAQLPLARRIDLDAAIRLLEYKYALEDYYGFSNMGMETELQSHTSELPELLSDPFSQRGRVMLDVGVRTKPLRVMVRFNQHTLVPSREYALRCVEQVQQILTDLQKVVDGETISTVAHFDRVQVGQ